MGWCVIKGIKRQPLAPHILQLSCQGGGSLWDDQELQHTYQWLTLGFFQRWFLPFQLNFFFMFLPLLSPIYSNFFNLWNTAWLASCEDLPTPTLTHKYLLSSQYFGRRPSVFLVHSSFWRVELALLFIVLLERFSNMCFEVRRGFWIFCVIGCEMQKEICTQICHSFWQFHWGCVWWVWSLVCVQCRLWGWPLVLVNDGRASQVPLALLTGDTTNLPLQQGQGIAVAWDGIFCCMSRLSLWFSSGQALSCSRWGLELVLPFIPLQQPPKFLNKLEVFTLE